jgi:hypothetical protein
VPATVVRATSAEETLYHQGAGSSLATVAGTPKQAQGIYPTFSRILADGDTWQITSVRLKASHPSATAGKWRVAVHANNNGTPGLLELFGETIDMTGLTTAATDRTVYFSKTDQNLDPKGRYWIVIQPVPLSTSPMVSYNATNSVADKGQMLSSTLLGWGAVQPSRDLNITVKGIYTYVP